jgi:hypothetical protein
MKKTILLLGALGLAGLIIYFSKPTPVSAPVTNNNPAPQAEIFNYERLGDLEFSYRKNPAGYVLVSDESFQTESLIEGISLFNEAEYLEMQSREFPSEYPPSIAIRAYSNDLNLSALAWAEENYLESNFTLRRGEPVVANLSGVEGIKYTVDGLYLFDVYIFKHKKQVYLLSVAYFDTNAVIYKDFKFLLEGLRFR